MSAPNHLPSQNEVVEEAPTAADFPCATPGPWRARMPEINGKADPIYWYIEGGAGYGYASLGAQGFCLSGYINEADARLMAAAPDLLRAATEAEAYVTIARASMAADRREAIESVLPNLRAAIAKATLPQQGESK